MVQMDKNFNHEQYVDFADKTGFNAGNPNMTMLVNNVDFYWINAKKDFQIEWRHKITVKYVKIGFSLIMSKKNGLMVLLGYHFIEIFGKTRIPRTRFEFQSIEHSLLLSKL